MDSLRPYEVQAIRALACGALEPALLELVLRDAEVMSCEHTGGGYYLTLRHPSLPEARATLHQPTMIGKLGDAVYGFIVFLGGHELMLECHDWAPPSMSPDVREMAVVVEVRPNPPLQPPPQSRRG